MLTLQSIRRAVSPMIPSFLKKYLWEGIYPFKRKRYEKEIEKRSKYSIFDYKELAKDIALVTKEHGYNAFYGHDRIIKNYLHKPLNSILTCSIEHAPNGIAPFVFNKIEFDGDNVYGNDIYISSSERRKRMELAFPHKKIFSIGLFIQYVEGILDKSSMRELKRALGKVLLVFPYHSDGATQTSFYVKDFVQTINQHKGAFDTVLVSLYWADVLRGMDVPFLNEGYKIVTAGHIFDWNFLPRLRTIIELSDMTMSNHIGTHLGYCICLGKPHYLFPQRMTYYSDKTGNMSGAEHDLWVRAINPMVKLYDDEIELQYENMIKNEIYDSFGVYKEFISERDKYLVRKYWGEWEE